MINWSSYCWLVNIYLRICCHSRSASEVLIRIIENLQDSRFNRLDSRVVTAWSNSMKKWYLEYSDQLIHQEKIIFLTQVIAFIQKLHLPWFLIGSVKRYRLTNKKRLLLFTRPLRYEIPIQLTNGRHRISIAYCLSRLGAQFSMVQKEFSS